MIAARADNEYVRDAAIDVDGLAPGEEYGFIEAFGKCLASRIQICHTCGR